MSGDLDSTFGDDPELAAQRKRERAIRRQAASDQASKAKPGYSVFSEEAARDEGRRQRHKLLALNAYDRHKMLVNEYLLTRPGATATVLQRDTSKDRSDIDVVRENHRFLWDGSDDQDLSWEQRLAKKYWQKLYHEYCITDLTFYRDNKIAMRFQTETEVKSGKGQFICGAKKCLEKEKLRTWEVNFAYDERGQRKNALVKLRLCPDCSYKLNYHHKRKEVTRKKSKRSRKSSSSGKKKKGKRSKRDKKDRDDSSENSSSSSEDDADSAVQKAKKEEADEKRASDIWKEPVHLVQEKSREEDFDDFLQDMFL